MLLNWLVLIPPLLAALMLPRFFLAAIYSEPPAGWENAAWCLAILCAAASTAYAAADMPTAGNARWSEARFVCLRLLPLVASAHFAVLAWAWRYNALPDLLEKAIGLARPGWIETLAFILVPAIVGGAAGGLRHRVSWKAGLRRLAAMLVPGALAAVALREIAFGWFSHPTQSFASINLAAFGAALLLALFLLLNFLVTGVSGRVTRDEDREWWGRSGGWMLAAILALGVQHAIVFWGPYGVEWLANFFASPGAALNAITGALAAVSAIAGGVSAALGFSSGSSATEGPKSHAKRLTAGALLFFVLFDVLLSYCTHRLAGNYASFVFFMDGEWYSKTWRDYLPFLYAPALLLVGLAMSWFINVNRFSLHTMYRNRLIRAFLGASNTQRQPHPFTGFDEGDNIEMQTLSAERPLHVINIALNLTQTRNLAWQERKAQSFTVTRLHAGSKELGYQPTPIYGRGLKLGTAVTISGAAANPNCGYTSAPLVTLLMTLFNVRLGWWLPNPGVAGRGIWHEPAPRFAAGRLRRGDRPHPTIPWVNLPTAGTSVTSAFTGYSCDDAATSSRSMPAATAATSSRISATRYARSASTSASPSRSTSSASPRSSKRGRSAARSGRSNTAPSIPARPTAGSSISSRSSPPTCRRTCATTIPRTWRSRTRAPATSSSASRSSKATACSAGTPRGRFAAAKRRASTRSKPSSSASPPTLHRQPSRRQQRKWWLARRLDLRLKLVNSTRSAPFANPSRTGRRRHPRESEREELAAPPLHRYGLSRNSARSFRPPAAAKRSRIARLDLRRRRVEVESHQPPAQLRQHRPLALKARFASRGRPLRGKRRDELLPFRRVPREHPRRRQTDGAALMEDEIRRVAFGEKPCEPPFLLRRIEVGAERRLRSDFLRALLFLEFLARRQPHELARVPEFAALRRHCFELFLAVQDVIRREPFHPPRVARSGQEDDLASLREKDLRAIRQCGEVAAHFRHEADAENCAR